jgi:toxin ParE1/3/4
MGKPTDPDEGPARFEILFTEGAEQDLRELHAWLSDTASPKQADRLALQISETIARLAHFPHRGSQPPELVDLGIHRYRQTLVKPWRLIYQVNDQQVIILLIADTRRDLTSLLTRRLLRS